MRRQVTTANQSVKMEENHRIAQ